MKNSPRKNDIEQIILMAWADTIPFETIMAEYGLNAEQVQKLMCQQQTPKTYRRWRQRILRRSGPKGKHGRLTEIASMKQKF